MTAQLNDHFLYEDQYYAMCGISEGKLFDPHDLGLKPQGMCSACWRGYIAVFSVLESTLVLDSLEINLEIPNQNFLEWKPPLINNVAPEQQGSKGLFNFRYDKVNSLIRYTGGLLLGRDFIQDLYVHQGFHPAWKYRQVLELLFEGGVLKKVSDHSEKNAVLRQKMIENGPGYENWGEYINDAYDRSY